jgi:hypothetical protein
MRPKKDGTSDRFGAGKRTVHDRGQYEHAAMQPVQHGDEN